MTLKAVIALTSSGHTETSPATVDFLISASYPSPAVVAEAGDTHVSMPGNLKLTACPALPLGAPVAVTILPLQAEKPGQYVALCSHARETLVSDVPPPAWPEFAT